jgi:hypothetical protein
MQRASSPRPRDDADSMSTAITGRQISSHSFVAFRDRSSEMKFLTGATWLAAISEKSSRSEARSTSSAVPWTARNGRSSRGWPCGVRSVSPRAPTGGTGGGGAATRTGGGATGFPELFARPPFAGPSGRRAAAGACFGGAWGAVAPRAVPGVAPSTRGADRVSSPAWRVGAGDGAAGSGDRNIENSFDNLMFERFPLPASGHRSVRSMHSPGRDFPNVVPD